MTNFKMTLTLTTYKRWDTLHNCNVLKKNGSRKCFVKIFFIF